MKKIILITLVCFSNFLNAQEALAKIEYSYAEEAFTNKDYKKALDHLEETKSLLGSTNARVMYLEIICRSNSLADNEDFNSSFGVNKINNSEDNPILNMVKRRIENLLNPQTISSELSQKERTDMMNTFTVYLNEISLEYAKNQSKGMIYLNQNQLEKSVNQVNYLLRKLVNNEKLIASDLFPGTYNNVKNATKTNLKYDKQNTNSLINNWLENADLVNTLCDTYIENFESEVPIDKLKKVYEIQKEYKLFIPNKELIKQSWEALNNEDYENALINFKELQIAGIESGVIIGELQRRIQLDQLDKEAISNIESNMIFVEGDSNTNLPDLYVSKYELTKKEYMDIMNPEDSELIECANCPITFTKTEADIFVNALNQKSEKNYRLPTEEEWYWFATGGLKTTDEERGISEEKVKRILDYAWCSSNSDGGIKEIGNLEPNELGLYDVWGNAAEYTSTNVAGGSYVTKSKNLTKGNSYTNSFNLDDDDQVWVGIRLVLTADKTKN